MNLSKQILGSSLSLPAYGRAGQGQHLFFLAAHFATCPPSLRSGDSRRERNTKFGGGKIGIGKRGRAKIPSPQSPSFLPARAFSFLLRLWRSNQSEFRSKKVRFNSRHPEKRKGGAVRVQLSALQNQKTEDSSLFFGFRVYSNSFLYL